MRLQIIIASPIFSIHLHAFAFFPVVRVCQPATMTKMIPIKVAISHVFNFPKAFLYRAFEMRRQDSQIEALLSSLTCVHSPQRLQGFWRGVIASEPS